MILNHLLEGYGCCLAFLWVGGNALSLEKININSLYFFMWMAWTCIIDPLMMEVGLEANTFGRSQLGVTVISIIGCLHIHLYSLFL